MATLTVFTPTYNRAYILPESYQTLCKQTCKDFVWLIVDDGSTDNTCQLVQKWMKENIIEIEYIRTGNKGKPSATNLSIEKCDTPLWVCLDSDDYLSVNAVEYIVQDYSKIEKESKIGGIIGNMFNKDNTIFDDRKLPEEKRVIRELDIRYHYGVFANLVRVYKTELLKGYRYPIIKNEKFIGESYLYERINALFLIERRPLYYAEYRTDGLTARYLQLHVENPIGYKLLKQQMMGLNISIYHRFRAAIMYVAACMLCKEKKVITNSGHIPLVLMAYPFGLIAYCKKYKRLCDKNRNAGGS